MALCELLDMFFGELSGICTARRIPVVYILENDLLRHQVVEHSTSCVIAIQYMQGHAGSCAAMAPWVGVFPALSLAWREARLLPLLGHCSGGISEHRCRVLVGSVYVPYTTPSRISTQVRGECDDINIVIPVPTRCTLFRGKCSTTT